MEDKILLAHGSGGKLSHDLIEKNFVPLFKNPLLDKLDDAAVFKLSGTDMFIVAVLCGRLAFSLIRLQEAC